MSAIAQRVASISSRDAWFFAGWEVAKIVQIFFGLGVLHGWS
jgi:hypothetical protein